MSTLLPAMTNLRFIFLESVSYTHLSGIYPAIKPGVYSDPLHRLILYSDYRYRWDILNQKISEGTWSQQGYIITFIDSSLDLPFHASMDSHGLRSMLLPGDYQGTVLKK